MWGKSVQSSIVSVFRVSNTGLFMIIPFYTPKCGVNLDRFTPHFGV